MMNVETLEKIKGDLQLLRKNAIHYLTVERNAFEEQMLKETDSYELFVMFLGEYLPRLYQNQKEEIRIHSAAVVSQMAISLGWMDASYYLMSSDFKGTVWGRTSEGGSYSKFTYTKKQQQEILEYLANANL